MTTNNIVVCIHLSKIEAKTGEFKLAPSLVFDGKGKYANIKVPLVLSTDTDLVGSEMTWPRIQGQRGLVWKVATVGFRGAVWVLEQHRSECFDDSQRALREQD